MGRSSRKLDHLNLALETGQRGTTGFDDVHFVHQALPEVNLNDISLLTAIGGLELSSPIIINAMTGGATETKKINEDLAIIARESGVAIAVGSQMSAIKNKEYASTYQVVRKQYPNGFIIGNLGKEASVEQAIEAVEMIEANALQIHLNVVQELVMPEGDRDFTGVLDRLQAIKEAIRVPLIVKEVGFGMSMEAATSLVNRGITLIDVGGKGGTNFAEIENRRRDKHIQFFNNWGIDTATSILEVKAVNSTEVIATGGIKDSFDIVKSIGLGASAVGIAGNVLRQLHNEGVNSTIDYINNLHSEIITLMTSLGAKTLSELQNKPMVIRNETKEWCELRGIDLKKLAQRN